MKQIDPHQQLYSFFNDLKHKINPRDFLWDYKAGTPVPYIVLDDFLPADLFEQISKEPVGIPKHFWNSFTRNGSYMEECKAFEYSPLVQTLTNCFNSGTFIDWLEHLTGLKKLVTDCHLIGAGLSKTPHGSSLKLHTDFNWNDEIALNRALSLIMYISPEWEESWGGDLEFWDFDRTEKLHSVAPLSNRLLIWNYDERFWHGYPTPVNCPVDHHRLTLRIFYYQSDSVPRSTPHRSLYWWDEDSKQPADDRTQK
jgi:hypothetical protein